MSDTSSPTTSDASEPTRIVIGIDLGTTNSLAAVRAGKEPLVLRSHDGDPLTPSMVCFHPDGDTLVGQISRRDILKAIQALMPR